MLATETARNPFARNNMTSSLHSRGYVNGSTTSFGSSSLASQPSRYGSNSTMRSQDDEKGLFPPPIPSTFSPPPPEPIQPDMNIMNRRADSNSSLYMICMNLRSRLADVPGFEDHIAEMEEEEAAANGSLDPVTLMWNFLRRGYPLITIYNALRLSDPIYFDQTKLKESKVGKAATFKFLEACMRDLKFEPSECFLITDLYGEDTTGFVKVTKVVNRVLDILKRKGLLHHNGPSRTSAAQSGTQTASHRQMIIDEIVRTERDYVQHLEMLQQFQNGVQQSGALPGDAVHDIFLNLNALLDFQRRFLIRIEQQNSLLESEQNWGKLFSYYKDGFRVYEPFLANQNRCNDTVIKEWNKLRAAPISADKGLSGICATPAILLGFLLKPFQRLSKYPLLLNELVKHGAYEDELHQDLVEGHAAAQSMMERAEEAVGRENRLAAVSELQSRVEDWKGHKIDHFGELLMFGSYTVLKGEGVKEVEREVSVIFNSLDHKMRACIRVALKHQRSLVPHVPQTVQTLHTFTRWFSRILRRRAVGDLLEGILEESEEGKSHVPVRQQIPKKRSMFGLFCSKNSACARLPMKSSPISPKTQSSKCVTPTRMSPRSQPLKRHSPGSITPESKTSIPKNVDPQHLCLKRISSKPSKCSLGMNRPFRPNLIKSPSPKVSLSEKLRRWSPGLSLSPPKVQRKERWYTPYYEEMIRLAIRESGHLLKFNGPFTQSNLFLFEKDGLPPLIPAIPGSMGRSTQRPRIQEEEPIKLTRLERDLANDVALELPVREQYKIYLFERILLCCKEINPNKAKNKMLSSNKPLVDKKGKPKLQLKGRIFMQNVTDVAYIMNKKSENPTFTLQIFWKGDPGVENFIIRFTDEATMKKWQDAVRAQQKILTESVRSSGPASTSATEFSYLKSQPSLKNPYREVEEDDDDDVPPTYSTGQGPLPSSMSRNASSNSLRSMQTGRMPPPRYPQQEQGNGTYTPPLSLNTNILPGASSPAEFAGNSYFSPSNDSPVSTRSNSQQSMYPFPRTQAPAGEWPRDANKHRTAPAIGRAPSREGPGPPNSYVLDGRTVTRPSLPAMAAPQYPQQQMSSTQSRLRSASTPDIQSVPGLRRQANGENVPVPPIPAHMVQMRAPVNRSHTTSPPDAQLPIRSATQSPAIQRDRGPPAYQDQASYDPYGQRLQQEYRQGAYTDVDPPVTQNPTGAISSENGIPLPPQLKVTIWFDPHPSHVTIVVPIIIKHRSLIDRIDSKMVKVSAASIAKGTARLRYKDSDGDIVTIRSDEDVHIAIEDWGTANEDQIRDGVTPDFQLYWQQN